MTSVRTATAVALAFVLTLGAGTMAFGQGAQGQQHMQRGQIQPGMPAQPGMMGQGMGCGTMGMAGTMGQMPDTMGQGGMWHMGPHMMSPDEMQEMMAHMGGMMGQMGPGTMGQMPGAMASGAMGQMGPGAMGQMGPDMMGQMPGTMGQMPGMMGQMGPGMGGWAGLEGRRVVPMMQLSTDDVRGFFERYLESLGNPRLKVGNIAAVDDDTITADIVTVDGSLVESFAVDRHTGVISVPG